MNTEQISHRPCSKKSSLDAKLIRGIVYYYMKLPYQPFKKQLIWLYQQYVLSIKRKRIITRVDGINYDLDLTELIDSSIYFSRYEIDTSKVIHTLCKKGYTVIDIGANIGAHTFRFAKLVGPTGRVIAIEPMSNAFKKLKRNTDLNSFKNILLEKIDLSNETKTKELVNFRNSWPAGGRSSRKKLQITPAIGEAVPMYALDDYVKKRNITRVDFIKLDVDGYEFKVLKGATETLKKYKPVIVMELGRRTLASTGDCAEDLIYFMSKLGYQFYYERDLKNAVPPRSILNSLPDRTINVVLSTAPLLY